MKVFVTGATGFIGSAIVRELLAAGHQVLGLARSDAKAASLAALGVEVQRGTLDDLDSLRSGAEASDGVIHTAYIHDFTDVAAAAQADRRAIEVLGEALVGSNRPFVITSGTGTLSPGHIATEEERGNLNSPASARLVTEEMALSLASRGVRVSAVRNPPTVHGEGDHGFVPRIISTAREKGVSAYPGDGTNRWCAVHRLDSAHLYRLALEHAPAGTRLHAIAEEGIAVRDIATLIGRHLNVPVVSIPPEQAPEHFGWLGYFFALDVPASSTRTQQLLDWHPVQLGLLEDLDHDYYYKK